MTFCAEHSAIATMVTAQEYTIKTIVAVWKDATGTLDVLPPCGRCREFMRQIDEANLETDVGLGRDHVVTLRELLPYHAWPVPRAPRNRSPIHGVPQIHDAGAVQPLQGHGVVGLPAR